MIRIATPTQRFIDTGASRTVVTAAWANSLQNELVNAIVGFGVEINNSEVAQLEGLVLSHINRITTAEAGAFVPSESSITDLSVRLSTILQTKTFLSTQLSLASIESVVSTAIASSYTYESSRYSLVNLTDSPIAGVRKRLFNLPLSSTNIQPRQVFFAAKFNNEDFFINANFQVAECLGDIIETSPNLRDDPVADTVTKKNSYHLDGGVYYVTCKYDQVRRKLLFYTFFDDEFTELNADITLDIVGMEFKTT